MDVSTVNDRPVMENSTLTVEQCQPTILTSREIGALDPESGPDSLTITVRDGITTTPLLHGSFQNSAGVQMTRFTQAQVNRGEIVFQYDGSGVTPQCNLPNCEVTVNDGDRTSNPVGITFARIPNNPPEVADGMPSQEVLVGEPFQFAMPPTAFSDADNETLRITASTESGQSLPPWMLFDSNTTQFSGTATQAGVHNLQVLAADSCNEIARANFAVTALSPVDSDSSSESSNLLAEILGPVISIPTAGGIAILAGKKYQKYKKDKETRKAFPFADQLLVTLGLIGFSDFNTTTGKAFRALAEEVEAVLKERSDALNYNRCTPSEQLILIAILAKVIREEVPMNWNFLSFGRSVGLGAIRDKLETIVNKTEVRFENACEAGPSGILSSLSHYVPSPVSSLFGRFSLFSSTNAEEGAMMRPIGDSDDEEESNGQAEEMELEERDESSEEDMDQNIAAIR